MLFELRNPANGKVTHCGVQEFTADWGNIHIPKLVCDFISFYFAQQINRFLLTSYSMLVIGR